MEQTPGYGVTPSSSGVTALSTSQGGMSGYVPPLPGISVWNMPPLEDAIPLGPVTIPPYQPPAGGLMAKIHDEHEGYSATDSSDAYTHPSATSTPPE